MMAACIAKIWTQIIAKQQRRRSFNKPYFAISAGGQGPKIHQPVFRRKWNSRYSRHFGA